LLSVFRLSTAIFTLILSASVSLGAGPGVVIEKALVDGLEQPFDGDGLRMPPGRHRLDFLVTLVTSGGDPPMKMRSCLEGFDNDWREAGDEMALEAQFFDSGGIVLSGQRFPFGGVTPDFNDAWESTPLLPQREPLFVPPGSKTLRLTFTSGPPSTTGRVAIDNLTLNLPGGGLRMNQDLWKNSEFDRFMDAGDIPDGTPEGWRRGGSQPAIAQVASTADQPAIAQLGPAKPPGLVLIDDDPGTFGEWISEITLDEQVHAGVSLSLSWLGAWRVIPGRQRIITYHGVGPGNYQLRVAAVGLGTGSWMGASTTLAVTVQPPLSDRRWFWPAVAGGVVALTGVAGTLLWRQRMQRRLDRITAQHTLERDRARIARDMHDDLGTRLTRITLLSALAKRDVAAGSEGAAMKHVDQMSGLAHEVIAAIDEIVWAVDPRHDTLGHFGTHLCGFTDEFFSGSGVRCHIDIPFVLPAMPMGAEVRHNLFLAVKEAMNNILKHASPCEARLELRITEDVLRIEITDHGSGFSAVPTSGNGLHNMERRLRDVGGECRITTAKTGTQVTLLWPLQEKVPS
jgi:signal transduction histidine kinase